MKKRYTSYVGRPLRSPIKTCPLKGRMGYARKKGVSGRRAHPTIVPCLPHKRRLSKTEWHIQYLLRAAKRGETVQVCNLKY